MSIASLQAPFECACVTAASMQVADAIGAASMRGSMLAETADLMQLGLAPAQVRTGLQHGLFGFE